MKYKISELTGSNLAMAAALALGYEVVAAPGVSMVYLPNGESATFGEYGWRPDRDKETAIPILEAAGLSLSSDTSEALTAALRELVRRKLGDFVTLS